MNLVWNSVCSYFRYNILLLAFEMFVFYAKGKKRVKNRKSLDAQTKSDMWRLTSVKNCPACNVCNVIDLLLFVSLLLSLPKTFDCSNGKSIGIMVTKKSSHGAFECSVFEFVWHHRTDESVERSVFSGIV